MTLTDPIADMLTRVRNAQTAGHDSVSMPSSKKLVEIARIMNEEGYIAGYEIVDGEPRATLEITLKYGPKKAKTIRGIKRISKPGLRIYAGKDDLPRVLGGLGCAIISTSNGVMTDRDARAKGIGGEVIAYIW
jgi:small subunit ribosomal protein S8